MRDHVVIIAFGTGRNGKSTLVETLRHVWGEYAVSTAYAAFTENRYRDDAGARPDIVRLRGARLITTSEGTFGSYLDESTIKRLSGGDTIFARGMRENGDEFTVVGKTILQTNHRPLVRGTDLGIKSRLRFLPFGVSFAGREDKELPEKLKREASGILNWALEGCQQFIAKGGLGTCPDVEATTRDYFSDMDVIQEFLDEWVLAGQEVPLQELYDAYRYHCKVTGTNPLSGQKFGERLSEKGIGRLKRGGRIYRLGIRLRKEVPKLSRESELPQ
jgi:putative DNA primase/helicase